MSNSEREVAPPEPRSVVLTLPWPPTINLYWIQRHQGQGRVIRTPEAQKYSRNVAWIFKSRQIPSLGAARLAVELELSPPDRRRRDIDNVIKPLLDALERAGAYDNDCQIDRLVVERKDPMPSGQVRISISEIAAR